MNKDKYFIAAYIPPPPENWDAHRVPDYKNPDFINDEQYGYLEDGGYTHAVALYEYGMNVALRALKMAEKHNIKYFVRDWDIYGARLSPQELAKRKPDIDKLMQSSAFAGLFMDDEPSAAEFAKIGQLKIKYDELTNGKDFFVNLLPTYATQELLGTDTYEQHIDEYIAAVKPEYVMYDHYPFMANEDATEYLSPDFLLNLEIVAMRCGKANIPMRTFIQSFNFDNVKRALTPEDIAWQIYTNFAYGSQGIIYFIYWSMMEEHRNPPNFKLKPRDAIITRDGVPTAKYYFLTKTHQQINAMYEISRNYKWNRTLCVGSNAAFDKLEHSATKLDGIAFIESARDLIVTELTSGSKRAFVVVNYSDPLQLESTTVKIKFEQPSQSVMLTTHGATHKVLLVDNTLELDIDCAYGVLISDLK